VEQRPTSGDAPGLPDRLVAVGAVLFGLGLVALLVEVGAGVADVRLPAWVVQLPFLLGVGFGVALLGLVLQLLRRRRQR